MTLASSQPLTLPDHNQLPESDGTFVKNFQEHPESIVLTDSIRPILNALHNTALVRTAASTGG
nr:hypothetical protein [Romeria gracilis]